MSAQEEAAGVRLVSAEEARRETREWLEETVVAQAEQVAAALALHERVVLPDGVYICDSDEEIYPCPTARALGVTA